MLSKRANYPAVARCGLLSPYYRHVRFHSPERVLLVPVYLKTPMLKNGEKVDLRLYRPEDKEHLVSFYTSLSKNTLRWALPPYDRARVERWIADREGPLILLALHNDKIVGHLHIYTPPQPRLKGIGELFIYITTITRT